MRDNDRRSALRALRRSVSPERPAASPRVGWPELRRIDHEGLLRIEDHSFSHPQLDRCSSDEARDEIAQSVEVFERRMGRRPQAFAYPDGACSPDVAGMLRLQGYEAAFLFDHRPSQVPGGDRLAISRLRVNSTTSRDRFATIVSGLHPAIHRVRGKS
jgi:peptidoglycan/xylan/chitin deacetylase (PgdA/CDA1 family)